MDATSTSTSTEPSAGQGPVMRAVDVPAVVEGPKRSLMMSLDPQRAPAKFPAVAPPPGFAVRNFRVQDATAERRAWALVEVSAGEFSIIGSHAERMAAAETKFDAEFGQSLAEMGERCFFVEDCTSGQVVGTTTAWRGEMCGECQGRIHWVAVANTHQGLGLSKVLLSSALQYLRTQHTRCYLTTQTTSARAIRLYMQYGFVPLVQSAALTSYASSCGKPVRTEGEDHASWASIADLLHVPR